jgi:hypothetical protein
MDSRSLQVTRKPKVFAKKQAKNRADKKATRGTIWKKQKTLITLFRLHPHHVPVAPTTWRMQNADGYGRLIEIRMYMEEARVYIPM